MTELFKTTRPLASVAPPVPEPDDIVERCLWRAGLPPKTLRDNFSPQCQNH